MRIVHISQLDGGNSGGGANKAAWRLHCSLRNLGYDSHMFVLGKTTRDKHVHAFIRPLLLSKIAWRLLSIANGHAIHRYPLQPVCGWTGSRIAIGGLSRIRLLCPDIVHLHMFDCLLRYEDIPLLPGHVCWTFHDMGCITGGCHCTPVCQRYLSRCGACPELGSRNETDASRTGWIHKSHAWERCDLTAICPSKWLQREAILSPMCAKHRIEHIPNGISTDIFNPSLRDCTRKQLGFTNNRFYILAGSASLTNVYKGFKFIKSIAPSLGKFFPNVELVLFGRGDDNISEMPVQRMGYQSTEHQMAALYAACDAYVLPTLVDNLPNTLIESIACGTPCVSFNVGGCPDIIRNGKTGWLAYEQTSNSLLDAIKRLINTDLHGRSVMRSYCREVAVSEFQQNKQALAYAHLYKELLETSIS